MPIRRWVEKQVEALPPGLREHVYRVREVALELARRHGVNEGKVWLAASAHDVARAISEGELEARAREMGLPIEAVEEEVPLLLHGPVAAEILRRQGLEDPEVYQAVYWHSTAQRGLGTVAQVVFLADKLEPGKAGRYPYLEELKALAMESLERAILEFLNREMATLLSEGRPLHPASVEARNELLKKAR